MIRSSIFILFLIVLSSCNESHSGKTVARVFDDYLYESDLERMLPANLKSGDSTKRAEMYINNWIREQVVLRKANLNLEIDEADLNERLESYKNELIIFDYQNKLIDQKLDQNVSSQEAKDYYITHQDNFILKNHVFKINYAVFEEGTNELRQFGKWMRADDQHENVMNFAKDYSMFYDLEQDKWSTEGDISGIIPVSGTDLTSFLKNKKYEYMMNDHKEYFIKILDYKLKGDVSPFEFVQNRIEGTLINKRKSDLLKKMREDLFNESISKGEIEIFK